MHISRSTASPSILTSSPSLAGTFPFLFFSNSSLLHLSLSDFLVISSVSHSDFDSLLFINYYIRHTRKPWKKFISADNKAIAGPEAIDFLDKLLRYDPAERLTAQVFIYLLFSFFYIYIYIVLNDLFSCVVVLRING